MVKKASATDFETLKSAISQGHHCDPVWCFACWYRMKVKGDL